MITKQQAIETIWGIAIADAIGNSLEFLPDVTSEDVARTLQSPVLFPTDDTQMTLFLYEGLLNGWGDREAALAWYRTQTYSKPTSPTGLAQFQSLYRREAPGVTCVTSCAALARGMEPENDSKGNGTVMRASPFAVMAYLQGWAPEKAYLMAAKDATITHKHPNAKAASVLLVGIYLRLFQGVSLRQAVIQAMADTKVSFEGLDPVREVLQGYAGYKTLLDTRSGWVAEEALAMAIGANLYSLPDYMDIVTLAVSGADTDSDTVASIAGGIAVASGVQVPQGLKMRLNMEDAIVYITERLNSL